MSRDVMRWRYHDTHPVAAPVLADVVVAIGDVLVYLGGHVYPAGQTPGVYDVGLRFRDEIDDYELLQRFVARRFLGVAMQRSRAGETASIRVATAGVFEYDLRGRQAVALGNTLGVYVDQYQLHSQVLEPVLDPRAAIGRAAAQQGLAADPDRPAQETGLVQIESRVMAPIS